MRNGNSVVTKAETSDTNYPIATNCWRGELCLPRPSIAKAGESAHVPLSVAELRAPRQNHQYRFVWIREWSRWDRRHRRQSRDGKRRASREASEFQIRVLVP